MKRLLMLLLLTAAFAVNGSLALGPPPQENPGAPPEKIVRVSFVEGDVAFQKGDADDWTALGANTPLMTGDSIYTPREARAEVSLGRGGFARLGDGTQLDIVSMTGNVTQLGISSGHLSLRVGTVPEGSEFEIDTPSATATIRAPGLYRVSVDEHDARYETVTGAMSVLLNGEQLDVGASESLALEGSDPPTYEYTGLQAPNRFDDWVNGRDARLEHSESARYVHPDVEGGEDLDAHGTWRPDPTYGRVWVPSGVGPEWAPYQSGRWIWQDPYGWTWVSYEDWGWAPYHYGRWVNASGSWAWVPPPPVGYVAPATVVMPTPVYAPALVAFIGGSNWHVGVTVGGGSAVGWVPLAPAEPYYYPWQPAPTTVVHYTNVKVVNAVTVVNQTTFVNGGGERIHVRPEECQRAPSMGYAARGIAPTQASLAPYPQRHLREDAMPVRAGQNRPLVARLVPPAKPVPFRQKAEIIRQTGRPVANPIAMDGDVGKPYHRGARVPSGVNAVSAISPERPAKMVARHGENDRRPRTIEHDMLPIQENMGGRPVRASEGAKGEPRGGKREHEQATSPMNEASTAPASPNTGAGAPASNQPPEKPKSAPQHGWQKEHRAPQPSPPAENGGREHGGKHQEGAAPGSAPTQAPAGNAPPEKPSPPPHRPEATPAPPAGKPPVSGPQQPHAEEKGKQPPAKEQPKGKKPEHKDKDKKEGR